MKMNDYSVASEVFLETGGRRNSCFAPLEILQGADFRVGFV